MLVRRAKSYRLESCLRVTQYFGSATEDDARPQAKLRASALNQPSQSFIRSKAAYGRTVHLTVGKTPFGLERPQSCARFRHATTLK